VRSDRHSDVGSIYIADHRPPIRLVASAAIAPTPVTSNMMRFLASAQFALDRIRRNSRRIVAVTSSWTVPACMLNREDPEVANLAAAGIAH
jgi:hypothetical protein